MNPRIQGDVGICHSIGFESAYLIEWTELSKEANIVFGTNSIAAVTNCSSKFGDFSDSWEGMLERSNTIRIFKFLMLSF